MSRKLKTLLRKQVSFAGRSFDAAEEDEKVEARRRSAMRSAKSYVAEDVVVHRKNLRHRHRTTLGVLEDVIRCPICEQIMQSPRMLPCQHTFCKKCLEWKFDEDPRNKENVLRCPVCKAEAKNFTRDNLPPNLSIESVLRAVDGSFVEARPRSLHLNFAPLSIEARHKSTRCSKCETVGEPVDLCQHCNQVFCQVCEVQHVAQLKEHFEKIIDQLQATSNKLDHRVVEFKEKTDNLKNAITKEFDAKIAALHEEKSKKLCAVDDFRSKGENTAAELKRRILEWQVELARQSENFDSIDNDKDKVEKFLELHRKTTEMISSASSWQTRLDDMVETKTMGIGRIHDKEMSPKALQRPKLIYDKKELQRPSGIALDPRRGEIYVTCSGSAAVLVFDGQYKLTRKIQNAKLMAPQGVAYVESLHEVFVTDKWKHAIYAFNRKGQLVREIGGKGSSRGKFRCPEGLAALQSRNWIYVADTGNDRVQIIGVDGAYKGGIGPADNRADSGAVLASVHCFKQPTDVAVSANAVVVADCGHNKIKVFNHRGHLIFSIGGLGTFKGLFKSPEVVQLDNSGNIYVGDSENGRVQVFSPAGSYLRSYGVQGTLVGHFGLVSGILVLPSNDILVSDGKRNTLELL
ncbi:RING finger protein nhl-1-like [Copidosoma floridanum]|uniref:RING finger protein nhl-1-like n=1 Tax=Copidosoma floridanum TaxID=29053 RepID=UPI0006C97EB7|nr:RING finger protein nhl-1-like [Copidosoma floridanum]